MAFARGLTECSVGRVDDLVPTEIAASSLAAAWCRHDTLARGSLERAARDHVDLIGQSDDYVLVTAVAEVIGLDLLGVAFDAVRVALASENLLHRPGDDEGTGSGDDSGLILALARVEACRREGERRVRLVLELGDMRRCKTKAARLRLTVLGE